MYNYGAVSPADYLNSLMMGAQPTPPPPQMQPGMSIFGPTTGPIPDAGSGMGGGGAGFSPFDLASLGMMGGGAVLDFAGNMIAGQKQSKENKKNRQLAAWQTAVQQGGQNTQLLQNLIALLLQGRQGVR